MRGYWPVDKVILGYFAFTCSIEAIWFREIPGAWWLLLLHAVAIALIIGAVRAFNTTTGPYVHLFRHWYPLLFVACCYREMAILIPAIRHARFDQALAGIDHAFWGADPAVWLVRTYSPALTESLQLIYTLFVPLVLFVPWLIWMQKRYQEFRYMAFLLALGFLVSYIGYLIIPARGPRFLFQQLEAVPLRGLWLFDGMQVMLNNLESAHYDCFPSGHVELTVLACWLSRSISRRLFLGYLAYTLSIIFATVYLRYHYTVDLLAGVVAAAGLILMAPFLYRKLTSREGANIGN